MRLLGVLLLACHLLLPDSPSMALDNELSLGCLSKIVEPLEMIEDESGRTLVYYGGDRGRLYLLEHRDGELLNINEVGVRGTIGHLKVIDLDGDGKREVITTTLDGEFAIRDAETLESIWRDRDENFSSILGMTVGNVDQDPSPEIVLLADKRLYVFDGATRFKEWQGIDETDAVDVVIADVDGDSEQEIILSSGEILSSVFFQVEWSAGTTFGDELLLFDIHGDGIPEIFGRQSDGRIRIFSAKVQTELW